MLSLIFILASAGPGGGRADPAAPFAPACDERSREHGEGPKGFSFHTINMAPLAAQALREKLHAERAGDLIVNGHSWADRAPVLAYMAQKLTH